MQKNLKYSVFTFTLLFAAFHIIAGNSFTKYAMKTVVIDAGHGGKDPGCHGFGLKTQEKNVTLGIALKVGEAIEKSFPNIKVIYTRNTDVFIELNERAAIANRNKADLFISIHCNSACFVNKKTKKITCDYVTHGIETYVMGLHMTDENLEVAKRENEVVLMEDNYSVKYEGFDPNSAQSHIIFSLNQNAYIDQSISLASKIEKFAEEKADRKGKGVKQAGFLVLWKTSMPSILIETGYLTNREEEKFLSGEQGQLLLSNSIFHAFIDYKDEMEGNVAVNKNKEVQLVLTQPVVPPKDTVKENPPSIEIVNVTIGNTKPAETKNEVIVRKEVETKTEPVIVKKEPEPKTIESPKLEKPVIVSVPKTEPVKKQDPIVKSVKAEEIKPEPVVVKKEPEPKIVESPKPEKPVFVSVPKTEPVKIPESVIKPALPAGRKEDPKKIETPSTPSIIFKVQIGAGDKMINLKSAPYSKYQDIEMENIQGIYKVVVGSYTDLALATNRQNEMRKAGFSGAFVVPYKDGVRIQMKEALSQMKK